MKTMEFTVSQLISATAEALYDIWLDYDSPRGPWLGDGARLLDASVGGLFYWSDRHWSDQESDQEWAHYGRFLTLERPSRIEYTWMSEFTHGLDSTVSITFREVDAGTEVTLRQSGLPDDQAGLDHKNAWIRILGTVGAHFASGISGDV